MMKSDTFQQMLDDFKSGTYNFTKDGECTNCGSCCSDFLPISKAEIQRIRKYVKSHNLKAHHNNVLVGEVFDATCPFRDEVKRKCDIYEIRPEICRAFKCDTAWQETEIQKKVFHQKNEPVSMRDVFFGDESAVALIRRLLGS